MTLGLNRVTRTCGTERARGSVWDMGGGKTGIRWPEKLQQVDCHLESDGKPWWVKQQRSVMICAAATQDPSDCRLEERAWGFRAKVERWGDLLGRTLRRVE